MSVDNMVRTLLGAIDQRANEILDRRMPVIEFGTVTSVAPLEVTTEVSELVLQDDELAEPWAWEPALGDPVLLIPTSTGEFFMLGTSGSATPPPSGGGGDLELGSALPEELDTAAAGTSLFAAHEDHVHPTTIGGVAIALVNDARFTDQRVPTDLSVTNAKVAAGAAIAYSKLNLAGAVTNADLAGSIAYSKLVLTGSITNADLAGSIDATKITGTAVTLGGGNQTFTATGSLLLRNQTAASTQAWGSRITADTVDRFSVAADGLMKWGTGSSTADVTLKRGNVGLLSVRNGGDSADADIGAATVSASTKVATAQGSNTAPSLTFTGDPNTGFYSPGLTDTIGIAIGGTQKALIDSNGGYAIQSQGGAFQALAQPSSAWQSFRTKISGDSIPRLDIMADGSLKFSDGTTQDTTLSRHSAGNLQIGTSRLLRAGLGGASDLTLPVLRSSGTAKSIPNNTPTTYNNFPTSGGQGVTPTANGATIVTAGYYQVTLYWFFATAAGGSRGVTMLVGGAGAFADTKQPDTFGGSSGSLTAMFFCAATTTLGASIYQNSGGAINCTVELHVAFLSA